MIVVADTSPLNYLILVEQPAVLRRLYGRIVVPRGVVAELLAAGSPDLVRGWAAEPPEWLEIHDVVVPENSGLGAIDQGEAEAITLAIQLGAQALLLIDDQDGRLVARQRGLAVIGTLGIIVEAAEAGFIDLTATLLRLQTTNFRVSDALVAQILERSRNTRT